jgi:hypothetical protein
VTGLRGFAESVLSIVPDGFSAYVRLFHPASRCTGDEWTPVPWTEIAEANRTRAHAGMQLNALTGSYHFMNHAQPGVFDDAPEVGSLPSELTAPLAATLSRHRTTGESLVVRALERPCDYARRRTPRAHIPPSARNYYLLAGWVEAVSETSTEQSHYQSPNLWWPDDHAWCVATEIDLNTTYIGCDDACLDEILALPEVEALPIDPATGIDYRSDLLDPFE